jgi:hypothetical protein
MMIKNDLSFYGGKLDLRDLSDLLFAVLHEPLSSLRSRL